MKRNYILNKVFSIVAISLLILILEVEPNFQHYIIEGFKISQF